MKVLGYISLGFSWLKTAKISIEKLNENKEFYEEKLNTANFYFLKILPRVKSLCLSAQNGSEELMKAKFN